MIAQRGIHRHRKLNQPDMSKVRNAAREFAAALRRWDRVVSLKGLDGYRGDDVESDLRSQAEVRLVVLFDKVKASDAPSGMLDLAIVQGMHHYPAALDFLNNVLKKEA